MKKCENYLAFHRINRIKTVFQCTLFYLIYASYFLHAQNSEALLLDLSIARELIDLYVNDGSESSPEYLYAALEHDSGNSDLYYLLAEHELNELNWHDAEEFIVQAFNVDNWARILPIQAISLHIRILSIQRNFREIHVRYMQNWREFLDNPEILLRLIDAAFRGRYVSQAQEVLRFASMRYSGDDRFLLRDILYTENQLISDFSRVFYLDFPPILTDAPQLLSNTILKLYVLTNAFERLELIDLYRELDLQDPLADALLSVEFENFDLREVLEIEDTNVFDYIAFLVYNEYTRGAAERLFIDFPDIAVFRVDIDRDGIHEVEMRYLNQVISSIAIELFQGDSLVINFQFAESIVPEEIVYSGREQNIVLEYSEFPLISSIKIEKDARIQDCEFRNVAFQEIQFTAYETNYAIHDSVIAILQGSAELRDLLFYAYLNREQNYGADIILPNFTGFLDKVESLLKFSFQCTVS